MTASAVRLNHAVLYVRDVERTREFYESVLDFKTLLWLPGKAAFFQAPKVVSSKP